jgi:hypothetical protein
MMEQMIDGYEQALRTPKVEPKVKGDGLEPIPRPYSLSHAIGGGIILRKSESRMLNLRSHSESGFWHWKTRADCDRKAI